jgi:dynactin 1
MSEDSVTLGSRVIIKEKDITGTVSYIGLADFAPGNWIGLTLDEPKGKNDGSVQGKVYFECQEKYGESVCGLGFAKLPEFM